ncbi:MAG: T9SS type A sorting domain-containing protein [bacterium]|nr:T9SS type A sorting domain-containing protein [bacterium]
MKTRVVMSRLITVFMALTACVTIGAQNLRVEQLDPSFVKGTPATSQEHHGKVTNTSSEARTVIVRYFQGGVALGHYASMCTDDACYTLPDEFFGPPYDLPEVNLAPGVSVALKAILNPVGEEGLSTMNFLIFDKNNPSDSVTYSVTFDVSLANSVTDLSDLVGTVVSPNPATDVVTVSGPELTQVHNVILYSISGNTMSTVLHDGTNRMLLDVSALPAGVYSAVFKLTSGAFYQTSISVVR